MSNVSDLFSVHDGYVVVDVHVQPRRDAPRWWGGTAPRSSSGWPHHLRTAGPTTRPARCLAKTLNVKDAAVSLVSGATSRTKRVRIDGVEGPDVADALRRAIAASEIEPGNPRKGFRG